MPDMAYLKRLHIYLNIDRTYHKTCHNMLQATPGSRQITLLILLPVTNSPKKI